jgi:predicted DNA binding CopG/RHH family protein
MQTRMAKKVTFGVKPQEQQLADVDSWVETRLPQPAVESSPEIAELGHEQGNPSMTDTQAMESSEPSPAPKEKTKRLTLDIPETLHRAIKGKAAIEGVAMVDMLRELLEEKYGNL